MAKTEDNLLKKVIWIINQYASHLEERHLSLARGFVKRGYNAIIITSSYHHGKQKYIFDEKVHINERENGVFFVYLRAEPTYTHSGVKRVLNMLGFYRMFIKYQDKIADIAGKPDYIIGSSAPPFAWELAYKASKKYKSVFIAEMRDIWPLSLIQVQGLNERNPLVLLFKRIEKRAYLHADAIVSSMPYAYIHVNEIIKDKSREVHWIPNGLDIERTERALDNDEISLPEDLDDFISNNWCCLYIGSIVKSENIEYIIRSLEMINNEKIKLAIIGEGNHRDTIKSIVKENKTDRIKLFDAIQKDQIPHVLSKGQCCLAVGSDMSIYRYGYSLNKLSDYLFSGKPTVFAAMYENVVHEAGHFSVPFGDYSNMAKAIEHIYKIDREEAEELDRKGKAMIRCQYDYDKLAEKYINIMNNIRNNKN